MLRLIASILVVCIGLYGVVVPDLLVALPTEVSFATLALGLILAVQIALEEEKIELKLNAPAAPVQPQQPAPARKPPEESEELATELRESHERVSALERALSEAQKNLESARQRPDGGAQNVVSFLGILQNRGRFVDFVMQDISQIADAQVGSVARFIHQGCRAALADHLDVSPVYEGKEGDAITLEASFDPRLFRVTGTAVGNPPYKGAIAHHGWLVKKVNLPKPTISAEEPLIISPAEVSVR